MKFFHSNRIRDHSQTMTPAPTATKATNIPINPALLKECGPETARPAAPFEVAELAAPEVAVAVVLLCDEVTAEP